MAQNDLIFEANSWDSFPVSANAATPDKVYDASTPNIPTPVMRFDGTTNEHRFFIFQIPPQYDGGGFDIDVKYAQEGTSATGFEFEVRMKQIADLDDLNADLGFDTQTAAVITDTPSTTSLEFNYSAQATLTHGNAGSPTNGQWMGVLVTRDAANDANGNDGLLAGIRILES